MGDQIPSQSQTLNEAAAQLQALPLLDLAPAGLLAIVGLLLLFYGQKLLKPSLVCAAIIVGAWIAGPLVGMFSPPIAAKLPSLLWPLIGAVAGLVFIALSWRLLLAISFGIVLAAALAIGSRALVETGFIDAAPSASSVIVEPSEDSALPLDNLALSASKLQGVGPALERVHSTVRPFIGWVSARWEAEPPQMRTLFVASSATGLFMGILLGLLLAKDISALLTAIMGALFLLIGGIPLGAREFPALAEPLHPMTWLIAWAAIAAVGFFAQLMMRKSKPAEDQTNDG
ncbi:MAG: hypothetical protein EXS10_09510 [Phycisphaerales bacterium]|nr:hypothetical protein [Phycisphaerales bacterium]